MPEKAYQEIFQRFEKKYLLTSEQFHQIEKAINPYMQVDDYGLSTICNIYYDTDDYGLIRTSLDKPPYKEKLRVRSYQVPKADSIVFVEIKKKWDGIVYKRRVSMTLQEAEDYLERGITPVSCGNPQILEEINYFMAFYQPKPKVYIAYDRVALFGRENDQLRVTFDRNIRSRRTDLDLAKGDHGTRLMGEDNVLMEIKVPGAYPMWMAEMLSDNEVYPTSFSKYGRIYQEAIHKELQPQRVLQTEQGKGGRAICLPA